MGQRPRLTSVAVGVASRGVEPAPVSVQGDGRCAPLSECIEQQWTVLAVLGGTPALGALRESESRVLLRGVVANLLAAHSSEESEGQECDRREHLETGLARVGSTMKSGLAD